MAEYDELLNKNIGAKNTELLRDEIPDWNRLSLNELDPKFDKENNKIISDEGVPKAKYEFTPDESNPINVHKASNDGYLDMELGIPRGGTVDPRQGYA